MSCNGILSRCHYFPISSSYESSFENGLRVCTFPYETSLHAHLRNVLKYENKGNNFFNKTLKSIITFEFSLQRRNFFLHRIFQTMAIFTFANALMRLLSPA